ADAPPDGILADAPPDRRQGRFGVYDVLVPARPPGKPVVLVPAYCPGSPTFAVVYDSRRRPFRERLLRASRSHFTGRLYADQPVNVIRHDDKGVEYELRKMQRNRLPVCLRDLTGTRKMHH